MTEPVTTESVKTQATVQPPATVEPIKIEQVNAVAPATTVDKVVKSEVAKVDNPTLPKGVYTELYNLREAKRQQKAEIEALKQKVLESTQHSVTTNAPKEETDWLENPDARFRSEIEKVKSELLSTFNNQQAETKRIEKVQMEGSQTIEYILTQPEINGDMTKMEEVDSIIRNDPRLAEVVKVAPMLAGKEALNIWKQHKGIDEVSRQAATSGLASIATPKTTSMNAPVKRSLAEVKQDFTKLHPLAPDYQQKYDSLMAEYSSLVK